MRAVWVATLFLGGACASPRRGVPIVGPIELSANAQAGKLLFMRDCNQCHPNGEAATGPAINNKPIPRAVMTLQIRKGVLGTMPKFSENDLSDAQIGQILDYVDALRKHQR
jgi:mono/diheme cytochrome c family protein